MKFFVDLNSDIGEGYGAYKIGMDEEIMKCVTSVNCACWCSPWISRLVRFW